MGPVSVSGAQVSDKSALSVITFFAGVRLLADSVSETPLRAVTIDSDGVRTPVMNQPVDVTVPFMGLSLQEGISQLVVSRILRGNSYTLTRTTGANGREILHPDRVKVEWDRGGFRSYKVDGKPVDPSLMTHVASFMQPGAPTGMGIIEYCRNTIGLGIALDEVSGSFFRNGVMSQGVISTEMALDADQIRATAEQFRMNHSGLKRANLPIVLGGGAKYTPMSLTPEDAQFIQSRQFQAAEIATLLGIPPHLLGQVDRTTSWGTGIEVQGRAFVDYTLRPYFKDYGSMFTGWLPSGVVAEFQTDDLTRADTQTRYTNHHWALFDGWKNVDQVRMEESLPPLPDGAGQIYRNPATQIPSVDQDGNPVLAPAAPLPSTDPNTGGNHAAA
jgi:HK97 family phage portal protein